ncbi:hypothetical protein [Oricola cellulosilytica]|uniref:Uncharacterized protein n=1 Tax=Oricola cellulosilytica TaxID=1429082 RepID=A0A4R0PBG1_9HYPH|nr:hypothetical protein [Oricola cellulosilytica]TCD13234.1 hypothetical protein E0D97_14650 [Oricola cellulosilytica]
MIGRNVMVGVAIAFFAAAVWWFAPGPVTTHPGPDNSAPRLAILPFEIESDDANVRAFAGGIADDITTELSRYPGLAVLSRETAQRFADDDGEAGELGVTHLLRGRIRRRSDRLTVNAWMTDTGTREQVWAKRYRGSASDLLEFQDTILEDVVAALMEALPASGGAPDASPGTESLDAYEAYLVGLTYYFELTPEANARAASRFRSALEADPGFAKARAGLAKTYRRAAFADDSFAEALGINWAEAYLELKVLLSGEAEKTADALVLEAGLALRRRDYAEAAGKARQALKLEPSNVEARQVLAETLIYAGDPERGENHARLALQLNPALPARPTFLAGLARYARGDTEGAITAVRDAVAMAGRREAEFAGLLAAMLGEAGDADGAEDMLAAYVSSLENRPRREWQVLTRTLDNPRARSWERPTVATAVYAYPFSDAAILSRIASGFEAAGLAGATLGHFPAAERNRLDDRAVRGLMFGASVEGSGETAVWRQTRSSDGAVIRTSGRGPMLQVPEGSSRVRRGEICDTWHWKGRIIESCAAVYRIPDDAPISVLGDYLLATEFGAFPFRQDLVN